MNEADKQQDMNLRANMVHAALQLHAIHKDAFTIPEGEMPMTTAQDAQDARMRNVPAVYKTTLERLACDLALKMEDAEVVFTRYRYTPEQAAALMDTQAFTDTLARVGKELAENGLSFRAKARAISEDLLPVGYDLATDPLVASAVRADMVKWFAKVAGNEPKEAKDDGRSSGGLNLSITFAGQAPMKVVQNEVVALEG